MSRKKCPICGNEMKIDTSAICLSVPPKYSCICPSCNCLDFIEKSEYYREYDGEENQKEQEQPDVDLEKEIIRWLSEGGITDTRFDDYDDSDIERTARHFYELGLNARKEETK